MTKHLQRTQFSSQHSSQVPGNPIPFPGLLGHPHSLAHTHRDTHIHRIQNVSVIRKILKEYNVKEK